MNFNLRKKVVFIQHRMGDGGITYSLSSLLHFLSSRWFLEISLVLRFRDDNPRMDLIPKGVKQIWLDECQQSFFSQHFDTVIAYMPEMADILDRFSNFRKKFVWVHGDYSKFDASVQTAVVESINKADCIITPSRKASQVIGDLVPRYKGLIHTIPHTMRDDLIRKKAREPIDDWPNTSLPTIVTVGKLFYNAKGLDRMIRVHRKLLDQNIQFQWVVVGDGPDRIWIEQMIDEYHLKQHFKLLGFRKNPYPYFLKADVFAILSYHEGYCLALGEAKILQKPIICTDFAGAADQIEHMSNGMIVENTDTGIEQGLTELLKNHNLRALFMQNLADYRYPNEIILKKLTRLFWEK